MPDADWHNDEVFEGNMDELFAKMEADELEGAVLLSPKDFAKMIQVSPQLVYYHIRAGHIKKRTCLCGRSVINVEEAKEFWDKLKGKGKPDAV
jgi:hypothetical protein